jgi:hypothetical protein
MVVRYYKRSDFTVGNRILTKVLSEALTVPDTPSAKYPGKVTRKVMSESVTADATFLRGAGIKFNPGHYAWYVPPYDATFLSGYRIDYYTAAYVTFINTLAGNSNIKGVLISPYWKALEGATAGDYAAGFAAMDTILAAAAAIGKKVIVRAESRVDGGFGQLNDVFPDYIVNGASYGTQIIYHSGTTIYSSTTAKVWETATMDRYIAMTQAYAARYDSNPTLTMWGNGETAISIPNGTGTFTQLDWLTQLKRYLIAARTAFATTEIRCCANDLYPGTGTAIDLYMDDLLSTCDTYAIAVGGPDVYPATVTQADRMFAGLDIAGASVYTDRRDRIPWAVEAQFQSFVATSFTAKSLFESEYYGYTATGWLYSGGASNGQPYVMPTMKVRYFIWYVNEYDPAPTSTNILWLRDVVPYINSIAGLIYTTRPTQYGVGGGGGGGGGGTPDTSVRSTSSATTASANTLSVTKPSGAITGDVILIIASGNTAGTWSDNNGATSFAKDLTDQQEGTGGSDVAIFSRRLTGAEGSNFSFNYSATVRLTLKAICIKDPHASVIYDVTPASGNTNINSTVGGTTTSNSITTGTAKALHFVTVTVDNGGGAVTATPSGYTVPENSGDQCTAVAYKQIAAAGATGTQNWSYTPDTESIACSFAIRNNV